MLKVILIDYISFLSVCLCICLCDCIRNRKLKTSTAPTKAKSREPAFSQALIQNKINRQRVRSRESGRQTVRRLWWMVFGVEMGRERMNQDRISWRAVFFEFGVKELWRACVCVSACLSDCQPLKYQYCWVFK